MDGKSDRADWLGLDKASDGRAGGSEMGDSRIDNRADQLKLGKAGGSKVGNGEKGKISALEENSSSGFMWTPTLVSFSIIYS